MNACVENCEEKCRFFGELIGLEMWRDESPLDVVLTEPVCRDLYPALFLNLDIGQSSKLLSYDSFRRTCKSKNSIARKELLASTSCDNVSTTLRPVLPVAPATRMAEVMAAGSMGLGE